MSGHYLTHLEILSTQNGDSGLPPEALIAQIQEIESKNTEFFSMISPVEFLSMLHYKAALLIQLDPDAPELATLVPFLQVARFYFVDAQHLPDVDAHRRFVQSWENIALHKHEAFAKYAVVIDFPECFGPESWADNLFAYVQEILLVQIQPTPTCSVFLLLSILSIYLERLRDQTLDHTALINLDLAAAGVLSMLIKHPATSEEEKRTYAEATVKLLADTAQPEKHVIVAGQAVELPDSTWLALQHLARETGYKPINDADFISSQYQTYELLAHAYFQLGQKEGFRSTFRKADKIFKVHGSSLMLNEDQWFSEIFNPVQKALVELNREFGRREKALHTASVATQLSDDESQPDRQRAARRNPMPPPKARKPYARKARKEKKVQFMEEVVNLDELAPLPAAPHQNRRFATPLSLAERERLFVGTVPIHFSFERREPEASASMDSHSAAADPRFKPFFS